jgi:cell division protein ZipA
MDMSFRTILLVLGGLILIAVLFDALRNRVKLRQQIQKKDSNWKAKEAQPMTRTVRLNDTTEREKTIKAQKSTTEAPAFAQGLVMISVHAEPGAKFEGELLLRSLKAVGCRFGARNIFHFERLTESGSQKCFSVAKLNHPGIFDINQIDSFACKGVLLFIDLNESAKPVIALEKMLSVADQLAVMLEGNLFEANNIPWEAETKARLLQGVVEYQAKSSVPSF